jgi:hypothetical protein
MVVLLLTAGNTAAFNQTRSVILGPYFNLSDSCVLVALMALLFDKLRSKKSLSIPFVVPVFLFVLTIAACQSFWKLGWTYETARAYRWGIQLPIAYFIGANLVTSEARAKQLVGVLLTGAILAAIQHLIISSVFWNLASLNMQSYHRMRTIAYKGGSLFTAFLLSGVIWKVPRGILRKGLSAITGVLFLATLLLAQSRSVWLATLGAVPCLLVLLKRRNRVMNIMRLGIIVVLMVFATAWVCEHVMPGLDISDMVIDRVKLLVKRDTMGVHMGTRERAFKTEMNSWMDGTLIFGRGLYFYQTVRNPESYAKRIAFGHLGYITYLSQMGLIGLVAYGLYFPLKILQDGRWLWRYGELPIIRYMALLGTASIICLSIMFIMSSSFLNLGYFAPGVLYGSMWSLARTRKETTAINDVGISLQPE